jgi:hypothetical protein
MSMQKIYIRVSKDDKGNIKREVMHNGMKIDEVSFVEALEISLQFVSSLRYDMVK